MIHQSEHIIMMVNLSIKSCILVVQAMVQFQPSIQEIIYWFLKDLMLVL